ncbi:MAG: hypothetical protein H0X30_15440 [Anaerolineae bacterium]|nr:hypothetical protein [Anaerolineae bacterium]
MQQNKLREPKSGRSLMSVLVHEAQFDGLSWSGVIQRLQKIGYNALRYSFP